MPVNQNSNKIINNKSIGKYLSFSLSKLKKEEEEEEEVERFHPLPNKIWLQKVTSIKLQHQKLNVCTSTLKHHINKRTNCI
jgi:hypothetical protein